MDEKKKKMLVVAGAILAYKPPTMTKKEVKEFVMPEVIEPAIFIAKSGQEKRRERRKQERERKFVKED